jgi:hypothetical protein
MKSAVIPGRAVYESHLNPGTIGFGVILYITSWIFSLAGLAIQAASSVLLEPDKKIDRSDKIEGRPLY